MTLVERSELTGRAHRIGASRRADFESFAREMAPKALRLARNLVGPDDAEDIAAEALARAYTWWGRVGSLPYRDGWVLRTAANLAVDRARRRGREVPASMDAEGPAPAAPMSLPDVEQGSVDRTDLLAALRHLSRRQRQAVVLHHLGGLPLDEIAAIQQVSTDTVKKHLARGLVGLRQQFGPPTQEHPDG